MTLRIATPEGRWQWLEDRTFVDGQWTANKLPPHPTVWRGSMFAPYWGEGTIWQRDVRDMPLDPNSAAMATWMDENALLSGFGDRTALNRSDFGTQPIATYVVDSTAPGAEFQYVDSASARGDHQAWINEVCTGRIPWPTWAVPAGNGDKGLAIYDIGTGIMREMFLVQPVEGKPGHWTVNTAGFSVTEPGMANLAETNPATQLRAGSNAVVGMHNPLGFIGISEVLNGQINHALAFTCSNMGIGPSWPARGADGTSEDPNAPLEGQWCRLPESVNEEINEATGQPWNPLTRLIIKAAKRYGMVGTDKNLFVHAFNAEDGRSWKQIYGTDPWAPGGACHQKLNGNLQVKDFPWHLTEWAPKDWGRPSPDFWLRKGQEQAWEQT